MNPARLSNLLALAGSRRDRDLARLEALIAADARLAAEQRALAATHAQDMAEGVGAAPLALIGKRVAWADARIRALAADRARLSGEIGAARAAATVSLGKHSALEELHARARRSAAARAEARAERDAPPRP